MIDSGNIFALKYACLNNLQGGLEYQWKKYR